MDEAKSSLKEYLAMLDQEYFSPPPVWPASGEEVLHELFYRDDLKFLFPEKFLADRAGRSTAGKSEDYRRH